jgi:hypothetical protein
MKKIAFIFALAFAFTTGMAAIVGHTDLAMAHCGGGSCSPYGKSS